IRDPAVLETIDECRVAIFDKTGTLTYGQPALVELVVTEGHNRDEVLQWTASLERYSRHPLAGAVLEAAEQAGLKLLQASEVAEPPGRGLTGVVDGHKVRVTGRGKLVVSDPGLIDQLPPSVGGLECVILIDGKLAATARFRDRPREDSRRFIGHLG